MALKTTRKRTSKSKTSEGLIAALNFISVAQVKEADVPYKSHCIIHNQTVMAFDGILTAGCHISEELEICPQTFKLIAALESTSKEVSITEMEGKLSVKSGGFSCLVPCWHEGMPALAPDPALCGISNTLKTGFDIISGFTVDNDKRKIVECSILLRENSMVATDTAVMLEFWHGHSLPTIVLPKAFVTAILNTNKKLKAFGRGQKEVEVNGESRMIDVSITFWFEDDSWIKTQVYSEVWPEVNIILNKACKSTPLPKGFFEALLKIEPFSKGKESEKVVYFVDGALQSHRDKIEGACCEVEGIQHGPAFNIKRLRRIEHCVDTVDFYSHNVAHFFSKDGLTRGCLMGVSV